MNKIVHVEELGGGMLKLVFEDGSFMKTSEERFRKLARLDEVEQEVLRQVRNMNLAEAVRRGEEVPDEYSIEKVDTVVGTKYFPKG